MTANFLGIILRSQKYGDTAEFYRKLGINFTEHQHGGPKHFETQSIDPNFVVEIYKKSSTYFSHALMVEVDSLGTALATLLIQDVEIKTTEHMRFTYIQDPDGTPIMLIEKTLIFKNVSATVQSQ